MQTYLSFEPHYHELTCHKGQPVWMPMYNPMRECVSQERLQLQAAGCEVETRLRRLPKALCQAAARTQRKHRYAKWAPVLEPVLTSVMTLVTLFIFVLLGYLIGASLATAYDPIWFKNLPQLRASAISVVIGLPVVGSLAGGLTWSWWCCASAH